MFSLDGKHIRLSYIVQRLHRSKNNLATLGLVFLLEQRPWRLMCLASMAMATTMTSPSDSNPSTKNTDHENKEKASVYKNMMRRPNFHVALHYEQASLEYGALRNVMTLMANRSKSEFVQNWCSNAMS
jgi:hypothetical protein